MSIPTQDTKDPSFWTNKWEINQTPWDLSKPHNFLNHLINNKNIFFHIPNENDSSSIKELQQELEKETENIKYALVPGCGSGYDCECISRLENVQQVIGVDLSPIAMDKASKNYKDLVEQGKLNFLATDFFKLHEKYGQHFDFVWDYTFLCAIDPSMRLKWSEEMAKLVRPGKYLLVLAFPIYPYKEDTTTPPFHVKLEDVEKLLSNEFTLVHQEFIPEEYAVRKGFEHYMLWKKN